MITGINYAMSWVLGFYWDTLFTYLSFKSGCLCVWQLVAFLSRRQIIYYVVLSLALTSIWMSKKSQQVTVQIIVPPSKTNPKSLMLLESAW